MTEVFGPLYADTYDALYRDKDYTAECNLIEHLFRTYGKQPIHRVLDLGCGTGSHALPLVERGYEVVGVDCSESMLAHARRKAVKLRVEGRAVFHKGDIRSIDLDQRFDAALMMFAVLGYQLENADVVSALEAARRHLRLGGLLICDVWYGPAVLNQQASQRVKVVSIPGGQIVRLASGELDVSQNRCTVCFQVRRLEGARLVHEFEEKHQVRYFFPWELHFFLKAVGFASIRLGAFPEFDRDPDETTWNVLGLAYAV